jgi:hypothetical protein
MHTCLLRATKMTTIHALGAPTWHAKAKNIVAVLLLAPKDFSWVHLVDQIEPE